MVLNKYINDFGEIPLKRPKGVSQEQWNRALELYKAAEETGDPYPELTVSQAALETGWFKKNSGSFNIFGQKSSKSQKGSNVVAHEYINGKKVKITDKFRDYDSLTEALQDRNKKWGSKYAGAANVKDAVYSIWQYDEEKGSGTGYATDVNYDKKLFKIMGMMGVDVDAQKTPTKQKPQREVRETTIDNTAVRQPNIKVLQEPNIQAAKFEDLFRFDNTEPKLPEQAPVQQQQYGPQIEEQQPIQLDPSLYDYIQLEELQDGGTYKVKSGDSLSKIAKSNNMSLEDILNLNESYKSNPNAVNVGDNINLQSQQPVKPQRRSILSDSNRYETREQSRDNIPRPLEYYKEQITNNLNQEKLNKLANSEYKKEDKRTLDEVMKQSKLAYNEKYPIGSLPKQGMYLDENSLDYRIYKEREQYYNPEVEENITSGDKIQDFIYNNQWVMDIPILGDKIKEEAKKIAKLGPAPSRDESDMERVDLGYEGDWQGGINDHKSNYKNKNNNKATLINQYFSEKDIYPRSIYKPTSDYLEFLPSYSIKGEFDDKINELVDKKNINSTLTKGDLFSHNISFILRDGTNSKIKRKEGYAGEEEIDRRYKEFLENKIPIYQTHVSDSNLSEMLDVNLAGHKTGLAWDEEVGLPYISISDAWDFSPEHYSKKWGEQGKGTGMWNGSEEERQKTKIQAALMHKAGNPFKVYDRFYFNPDTKEYMTDEEVQKMRKSI